MQNAHAGIYSSFHLISVTSHKPAAMSRSFRAVLIQIRAYLVVKSSKLVACQVNVVQSWRANS